MSSASSCRLAGLAGAAVTALVAGCFPQQHLVGEPWTGAAGAAGAGGGLAASAGRGGGSSVDAMAAGGTGGCAGPLTFADPDVEAWVRAAISLPAGPIFATDVASLTDLSLGSPTVPPCPPSNVYDGSCIDYISPPHLDGWATSLEGVECLTAVASLWLDAFQVKLEPLRALPHLATLFLGPVDRSMPPPLPQVKSLECGAVPAHGFVSAFPGLTSLTVHGVETDQGVQTPLGLDEVGALSGLTTLFLRDCALTDVSPLTGLTSLTQLDLSGNTLTHLDDLVGLPGLTTLSLEDCGLTDISPLSRLTNLTQLDLYGNAITDLSPLVANAGLGAGDSISLGGNAIDCASQGANINALRSRGVVVELDVSCP